MKNLTLLILLLCLLVFKLQAQSSHRDSVIRIAKKDAQSFVLNDADLKRFRQDRKVDVKSILKRPIQSPRLPQLPRPGTPPERVDYTSDFFKPSKTTTRDTSLLSDSIYVKSFRASAYKQTASRHTMGHYVALVGGITIGITIIVVFVSLLIANAG